MKVILKSLSEELLESRDYCDAFEIHTTKNKLSFWDGEPEDSNISRGFSDVFMIADVIKEAHAAGLAGETLEIENGELTY